MQTFKKHKMGHGSKKVENHWPRLSVELSKAESVKLKSA